MGAQWLTLALPPQFVQVFVAGSYSSTVARPPLPLLPPIAYTLPLGAAAAPSPSRAVGMGALATHVFVAGSYSSTAVQKPLGQTLGELLKPPIAYSLPFVAVATPSPYRSLSMEAWPTQRSPGGRASAPTGSSPASPPATAAK